MKDAPSYDDCFLLAAKLEAKYSRLSDSFDKALATIMYDNASGKMLEACDLYLYQTAVPGVRKFGISQAAELRSKTAKGAELNRYQEMLCKQHCQTRLEAVCMESALKELVGIRRTDAEEHVLSLGRSTELTAASRDEFAEYAQILQDDWQRLQPLEFVKANCRSQVASIEFAAWRLTKGLLVPALLAGRLSLTEPRIIDEDWTVISVAEALQH